jgi:hypothetical protein
VTGCSEDWLTVIWTNTPDSKVPHGYGGVFAHCLKYSKPLASHTVKTVGDVAYALGCSPTVTRVTVVTIVNGRRLVRMLAPFVGTKRGR